jgi:tetratricopeptide (TPR) repeat protein
VRIAAVGFGTPDGIELRGPGGEALRDRDEAIVVSRRADGVLRRVAAATEGSYLREREDAPSAARLLPAPSPGGAENEPPAPQGPTVAIVLALALVGLDLALSAGARRARPGRLARAAAPALAGLAALALGAWSPEHEGDRLLDAGEPREALSVYRKIERTSGASARTGIRIGNALFRLGQHEPALAAYLDVLRRFGVDDPDARFVAAYNMGTVLLAQERWPEARDALWSALLERATSVEAKFNYEWALARIEPEPDVPLPPMPPPPEPSPLDESPEGPAPDPSASDAREQEAPQSLSQEEAERWLESLVEAPGEPLRRQIARGSRASSPRSEPGQTW